MTPLFQVNGLVVVVIALAVIWGLVELVSWIRRLQARVKRLEEQLLSAAPPPPPPVSAPIAAQVAPAAPPPAPASPGIPPEILTAISAAIHFTLAGMPHRIRMIAPLGVGGDWAREGRRTIFTSHQPR